MFKLRGSLVSELVLNKLTRPVLPLNHLHLPLVERLLLRLANHQILVLRLGFLLSFLVGSPLLVHLLLLLRLVCTLPAVIFCFSLAKVNSAGLLFSSVAMLCSLHCLFHPLGLSSGLLISQGLSIAHALVNDFSGSLARLVDFLVGLPFF